MVGQDSSVDIATYWTAGVRFPVDARDFSLHSIETDFMVHPASYTNGIGGYFPGGKATHGVKLTAHLHLVLNSRMAKLHLYSPTFVHCVVLN
jgi:hypothetical protein